MWAKHVYSKSLSVNGRSWRYVWNTNNKKKLHLKKLLWNYCFLLCEGRSKFKCCKIDMTASFWTNWPRIGQLDKNWKWNLSTLGKSWQIVEVWGHGEREKEWKKSGVSKRQQLPHIDTSQHPEGQGFSSTKLEGKDSAHLLCLHQGRGGRRVIRFSKICSDLCIRCLKHLNFVCSCIISKVPNCSLLEALPTRGNCPGYAVTHYRTLKNLNIYSLLKMYQNSIGRGFIS